MRTTDGQGKHHRTDVSLPSDTSREVGREPVMLGSEIDLLATAPRWALCPLDQHAHAIDAWADHPPGVWIARCGYWLSASSDLHDDPPERHCPSCARWSPMTAAHTRTKQ